MTLPLRKKLPTTVQTIRSGVTTLKRTSARGLLAMAVLSSCSTWVSAQAPQWQPSRLTPAANLPTLPQSSVPSAGSTTAAPASSSSDNDGVVLRWRRSDRVSTASTPQTPTAATVLAQSPSQAPGTQVSPAVANTAGARQNDSTNAWSENPLRDRGAAQPDSRQTHRSTSTASQAANALSSTPSRAAQALAIRETSGTTEPNPVRWSAYQTGGENAREAISNGTSAPTPQLQAPATQLQAPPLEFVPPTLPQTIPPAMPDPLARPEQAPPPPRNPVVPPQSNSAAPAPSLDIAPPVTPPAAAPQRESAVSPFDSRLPDNLERGSTPQRPDLDADLQKELGKMVQPDDLMHCEQFRDQLRNSKLNKINLNSAPHFGQGLNVDAEEEEKMRQNFAANSERRQWCDREGRNLITGRLIDLRHEQVVLDVDGVRREIALRDLCDVDLAYIGKAWNLPVSCGTGIDAVAGRSFAPSAVQWKASGLCHKPLYFEEVQLERYGHDLGPVLQPIASTVHFFGNIAVLPYKMGIHPPHECQYSLGYYRPGSCAPYMMPPVPISLRGAAAQAVVVTGAAAIIP